jgi:chemotaxis protein methyltransferase CheR
VSHLRVPSSPAEALDVQGVRVPERTLSLLRDLIGAHTGMYYDEGRLTLLRDRLVPLALERGFDSLLDYYYLLKYDNQAAAEWALVIDALSVQESYFWREFDQVRALADLIVPRLAAMGRRPIRIWSVPCAGGEEPLSIAMALEEASGFGRTAIEIHAGDASASALERAAAGRYGGRAFRQLPNHLREKYFDAEPGSNLWTIKPSVKARVSSWARVNVVQREQVARLAGADVIFCRNLFIYFTEATVRQVVEQFAQYLPSPGFLCVGTAESLLRITPRFELQDIGGAHVYVKP